MYLPDIRCTEATARRNISVHSIHTVEDAGATLCVDEVTRVGVDLVRIQPMASTRSHGQRTLMNCAEANAARARSRSAVSARTPRMWQGGSEQ